MIRLAKTTFWKRSKTRLELWEEHLRDPIVALDKALKWKISIFSAHHRTTRIRRHNFPLPSRLGSGEGSIELPHNPRHAVPGNA